MNETGKRIKALRRSLGMTQSELAGKIGTIKQTVYKYESGKVENIPLEKVVSLAIALKTSAAYLHGYVDDPRPASERLADEEKKRFAYTLVGEHLERLKVCSSILHMPYATLFGKCDTDFPVTKDLDDAI